MVSDMNEILSFPRKFSYQNVHYVKLNNIKLSRGKRLSSGNYQNDILRTLNKHRNERFVIYLFIFLSPRIPSCPLFCPQETRLLFLLNGSPVHEGLDDCLFQSSNSKVWG